eukprot:5239371-Prymnesium_polylepis.2
MAHPRDLPSVIRKDKGGGWTAEVLSFDPPPWASQKLKQGSSLAAQKKVDGFAKLKLGGPSRRKKRSTISRSNTM